jgi:hypothetical protein
MNDTDKEALNRVKELLVERYPTAAGAVFETSDQRHFGFRLLSLRTADGLPLQVSDEVDEAVWDILCDVAWDGVMREDAHGYATVILQPAKVSTVKIRTLADLKRAVTVGAVVHVTGHRFPDLNGRREVLRVRTKGFSLSLPDGHPRKAQVDAEGGSWQDFAKASEYVFDGTNVVWTPMCVISF